MFPGFLKAEYNKDDPSTWKHFQTAEQKSTEEGRMTDPFASDDGRYDSLSGRRFSIQTQRGGSFAGSGKYSGSNASYAMDQLDKEWDHRAELKEIQSRSTPTQVAGSGGSGRGYSSGSRSGRGA